MNNIIVLPMVIPLLTGVFLVFFRSNILFQRFLTILSLLINTVVSIYILNKIQVEGILSLDFGGWVPPFGILFVADSFAMLLVTTTNIISLICVLFAMHTIGEKRESYIFILLFSY